jgi:acyl-CoA oxidase
MGQLGIKPNIDLYEMSRNEAYIYAQKAAMTFRASNKVNIYDEINPLEEVLVTANFHFPGSIGMLMTTSLIRHTGTPDQVSNWMPKIESNDWFSCYAQTELAHGSDVQNLKTIATFDPKTQEFIFHSPSIDSIKWWPGDLGVCCTHGAIFARLISNGVDHGVQPFFLALRDVKTHIPYPGVEVGDIGPKMGFRTKDNGYLKFNQFRVSKDCLLGKYIAIDSDGKVTKSGNPKAMYSSMMRIRTLFLVTSYTTIFKSVQIATRYSLFRKQFMDAKKNEIPIYEYQSQQDKLFREIARAYMMNLTTSRVIKLVEANRVLASKGDFSNFQNCHIILCACKALFVRWQSDSIKWMILACGGHGYSQASGLPHILVEEFPNQIMEGDFTVLMLQVARYLIKSFGRIKSGKLEKVTGPILFLKDVDTLVDLKTAEGEDSLKPKNIIDMFRKSVAVLVSRTSLKMFQLAKSTKDAKMVWDKLLGVELLRMSILYSILYILEASHSAVEKLAPGPIRSAMELLYGVFAINLIDEHASYLLEAGALNSEQLCFFLDAKVKILDQLKDHGLVLSEGMQWSDDVLNSAIARNDGKPYETLYKWAKEQGAFNQYLNSVHPAILEYQQKVVPQQQKL